MEHARAGSIAKADLAALRTRQMFEVAPAAHDLRLRELFGVGDPRSGVGDLLSRTRPALILHDHASSAWTLPRLRSPIIPDLPALVLKTQIFAVYPGKITLIVCDESYTMETFTVPSLKFDVNDLQHIPESGMGLFLIHSIMDEVTYTSRHDRNVLTMIKNLAEAT